MSYKDEQWNIREATLGDIAEGAFEEWVTKSGWIYERYGLERPAVDMRKIIPFVRYTPDYLLDNGVEVSLVEVQGCGRDQTFKFKVDKLDALQDWWYNVYDQNPVRVWLWDEFNQRSWLFDIQELMLKLDAHGVEGSFPEGKEYVAISTEHLDGHDDL